MIGDDGDTSSGDDGGEDEIRNWTLSNHPSQSSSHKREHNHSFLGNHLKTEEKGDFYLEYY